MLKKLMVTGALVLSSTLLITASAQQTPPTPQQIAEGAASTRQAVFKLLSFNMGPISGMARGTVEYDAAIAVRNAERIAALAEMIPDVFTNDTRAYTLETAALPVIWEQRTEFQEKAANLIAAASTFADIARAGDQRETAAAVRAFGATCGNCHETFRYSED